MSATEAAQAWDGLMEFLSCDEDLTDDEVVRDLQEAGVDTGLFMARIGDTVRKGIQAQRRKQAEAERADAERRLSIVRERVIRFPIEAVRQIAQDAEHGKFGIAGQQLAIACRNKQYVEPTQEELRALVEDILMIAETEGGNDASDTQG